MPPFGPRLPTLLPAAFLIWVETLKKKLGRPAVEKKGIFLIRYEPLSAMSLVLALNKASQNYTDELVASAQATLMEARKFFDIKFAHVKGHSANFGNDRPD